MTRDRDLKLKLDDEELQETLLRICRLIADAGGRAWLVGGTVRDAIRGDVIRDLDLEAFGLAPDRLIEVLQSAFELDLVGRSFGIIKLRGLPVDVGLPRRETKLGLGHRGFAVHADPGLPVAEAAARRDFTMNAVYLDPLTGDLEDPHGGIADLDAGLLRHTSQAFVEDPLRVLRAMQLASRFDLTVAPETVDLCRAMELEGLAAERVAGEWFKLVTLGVKPSRGLGFLKDCRWLRHFPELAALDGCPQDERWHPEGDVWVHTLHCLDAFAREKLGDYWEDLVVGLAVLCHDLGKPDTTTVGENRISAFNHNVVGVQKTRTFLGTMTGHQRLLKEVEVLVREHLHPTALYKARSSDAAVRRLAARVGRLDRLVRVARADVFGRPPLPATDFPAGDWLLAKAHKLGVVDTAPRPLVQGRDLLALGLKPGPRFGTILDRCYEAQLAGAFTTEDGARRYAAQLLIRMNDES